MGNQGKLSKELHLSLYTHFCPNSRKNSMFARKTFVYIFEYQTIKWNAGFPGGSDGKESG